MLHPHREVSGVVGNGKARIREALNQKPYAKAHQLAAHVVLTRLGNVKVRPVEALPFT